MMRASPRRPALVLALFSVGILGGCSEARLMIHAAKKISAQGEVTDKGAYKIGNPYKINGLWYYPKVDYDYTETGIASWYGPNFHGKTTANGENFDQNLISAAHRTLPLPSLVRVTNLENGRSIRVRVNDRGPFAHGRIIDMSRRGAQLLGFQRKGTAKVRVEILAQESRQMALGIDGKGQSQIARASTDEDRPPVTAAPRVSVRSEPLGGEAAPATARQPAPRPIPVAAKTAAPPAEVERTAVGPTNMYIQAGAFTDFDNANRLRARLAVLGPTRVNQVALGEQTFFRLQIGPITDLAAADKMLERVINAGHTEARLIVDR
jgi:rare lipoprotein A